MKTAPTTWARQGRAPKPCGFTLIELMITVVVIAVLASIALPSFVDQVRRSRRAEAITAINQVMQAQERWRANNATYAFDAGATGLRVASAPTVSGTSSEYPLPSGYYVIRVSTGASAPTAYDVRAAAVTGSGQDRDRNCQCLQMRWSANNANYESGGSSGTLSDCSAATWTTTGANRCWGR